MTNTYSSQEIMTAVAARYLKDRCVCFVGIGMPSTAANLARLTHAENAILIYESGTIGSKPDILPLSIGDSELAETADLIVSVPELFSYWLQGRRIDIGFLGAAQIDRYANINTTVIGDYVKPKVRLPGAGGAPEIAANCNETIIMLKHSKRSFVERLSFITSVGHLNGHDTRLKAGLNTHGPIAVITDLCVLTPNPKTKELELKYIYPGITPEQVQEETSWELSISKDLNEILPPSDIELNVMKELHKRTEKAINNVN